MPKTFLHSQPREVSPDLPLKKQTTQDEKKQPKFKQRKQSRENSLNFTVDNQMDMLSVNFRTKQRFGGKKEEEDGILQGTFSLSSAVTKKKASKKQSEYKLNMASDDESVKITKDKMVNIYLQKPYQVSKKKDREKGSSPVRLFQAENILYLAGVKNQAPKRDEEQFTTFQPKDPDAEFNLLGNSIFSNINNLTQRTDGNVESVASDDKEFWTSLYDKFLIQLDKRIDQLSNQI